MEVLLQTKLIIGGQHLVTWIDLVTFLVSAYVIHKMNGGKLMYTVWLVGATGLVGFLALWTGGLAALEVMSIIKSVVLLISVVWLLLIFRDR